MSKNLLSKILIFILIVMLVLFCAWINNNNINEQTLYDKIVIDETKLNIFYFYIGQADCTLIKIGDENMLIDTGNEEDVRIFIKIPKREKHNTYKISDRYTYS